MLTALLCATLVTVELEGGSAIDSGGWDFQGLNRAKRLVDAQHVQV